MKKVFFALSFVGMLLAAQSCKRKVDIAYDFPQKQSSVSSSQAIDKLKLIFKENAPNSESFSVDAATGGTIQTSNNTTYTIAPNIFEKQDGSAVTGEVTVIVKEIFRPSQMILDDKPTMTADGKMLESFGEFKVDAVQGQDVLKLKAEAVVQVAVPRRDSAAQGNVKGIPMWNGDTTIQTSVYGRDFENNNVTITKEVTINRGIDWTQSSDMATSNGSTLNFNIDKLGTWRNCDLISYFGSTTTTVIGYFTNVFNDSSDVEGYMGVQPNLLFFKRSGVNTLIKLYNRIIEPPTGKDGFLSYVNTFPVGMSGTFLAIVYRGGKFYVSMKDVTIGSPSGGQSFVGIPFTLDEVTETEMLALIETMNNK